MYDSYEEYPAGSYYESPPLHAFILATVGFIAGGFRYHSSEFTMWVLIFLPPVLAVIAIWALHAFARFLFKSIWVAHISALLAALFPLSIIKSNLGNIDHHVTDYLAIVLYFLTLARAVERIPGSSDSRSLIKITCLPGAMLAFGIYVWQASFLHGAVTAFSFFIYYLLTRHRTILLMAGLHYFWCVAILIPGALYAAAGGIQWNSLAYFSFAQAIIIAVLGCFFLLMYFIFSGQGSLWRNSIGSYKGWAMAGAILVLLFFIRTDIITGIAIMVNNPNPWLKSVTESTPILYIYHEFSLEPLLSNLSYGSLLFPILFLLMLWMVYKNKGPFSWLLVCSAGLIYGVLTLIQARFGQPFTIPLSLILGYWLVQGSSYFTGKWMKKTLLYEGIIPVLLVIILVIPCFMYYKKNEPLSSDRYLKEAFEWLRNATPETTDFDTAQKKPEYSVLADWDYGTPVEYYAHRPTIIDARGPIHVDWSPVARYLLSTDEKEAEIYREMLGARFVMLTDWFTSLRIYPSWINADWNDYFRGTLSPSGEESISPTDKLVSSIGFQLTELSGNALIENNNIIKPALQHYRLAWESTFLLQGGRTEPTSAIKIFEHVKGAVLHCTGTPGSRISVTGMVLTNTGRTFLYQNYLVLPSSGDDIICLPYPTERTPASAFIERYYIQSGDKILQLHTITNDMIISGASLSFQGD